MKRFTALFLLLTMIFSLSACGGKQKLPAVTAVSTTASVETAVSTTTAQPEETETPVTESPKILVAYFSATHTTQGVAEKLAAGLNADLYEIVPAEPYTSDDLNYSDSNSRTTREMNDSAARPAISGSVDNMEQYDVIFLGYPIWWGNAPRILSTFLESYDFSGKTVVPFCTSGSSQIGSSAADLEALASGGTWLEGKRLSTGDSQETLVDWANSLGVLG